MSHEMEIVAAGANESSPHPRPLPDYRERGLSIRPGTLDDIPFLDSLQKLHTKQVGWMPTAQFEGKIKAGHVLVAEEVGSRQRAEGRADGDADSLPTASCLPPTLVGYLIGNDQYFKRDDVGIIYQLNVLPTKQRGFIGATLLKAMFDRAAYGCRLFCCWCAQDIEANRFWEACGFVPLAFRTGSRTKGKDGTPRVHIFWQKRIRSGDTTTPWWFPSQTGSGAIREDRLVLPIPPGTHWSEAMPVILPGQETVKPQLTDSKASLAPRKNKATIKAQPVVANAVGVGFLRFADPTPPKAEKAKREKTPRVKVKNDPKHVAAARELRDRWLEEVNSGRFLPSASGKYEVTRALPFDASTRTPEPSSVLRALPALSDVAAAA